MAAPTINCPYLDCKKELLWNPKQAGREGTCPGCGRMFTYPRSLPGVVIECPRCGRPLRDDVMPNELWCSFCGEAFSKLGARHQDVAEEPMGRQDVIPPRSASGLTAVEEPPSLAPGSRVGQYRIVSKIDRGGFGFVYKAEDTGTDGQSHAKSMN